MRISTPGTPPGTCTKTAGTNIVGGSVIGGNFWAKPDGTGHSQIIADANKDGITDSAYIDESGYFTDYLPLAPVYNPQQPILPVANFSANVTEGYAPLSVQFNDSSENAARWSWDFGNGVNSTEQNPTYTYPAAGNYTVNLTTSNGNGTDSKLATINVSKQPAAVFPVADFTSNVTEGYAPLSVQFTDLSQNSTSRSWDFNNDGQSDSNRAESSPCLHCSWNLYS